MTPDPDHSPLSFRIVAGAFLVLYAALLVSANSGVAGGSDSSGYLNAARLLARGRFSEKIEVLARLGLPASDREIFIPLGFTPAAEPGSMAPRYPPGLPLHMAAAAIAGGWRLAPFFIGPIAALAALALVYGIGRELGLARGIAAAGVALLAASPIFFGMAVQPMADVPATAWVCAAIFFALRARRQASWAFAAGAAFGIGVLVRPTDVLAVFAAALTLPATRRAAGRFLLGAAPFAALLILYDTAAFGRPTLTGYGPMLAWTMSFSNFLPEIRHYGYWVPALLTPLVPLAWLALPFDLRVPWKDRGLLLAWFGAFFAFYAFYEPYEDWWSVRFLLPGIPAMFLAALLLARDAGLPARPLRERVAVGLALVAAAITLDVIHIRRFDLLSMKSGETVYRDASRWADRQIPAESLILSMQMSGALKYYTARPIARWDALRPATFPRIRQAAGERGFRWYALLRAFEEGDFARDVPGNWTRVGTFRDVGLWRLD